GCGKGYLTFAAYDWLQRAGARQLNVRGIEARIELVELCNRVAAENRFDGLRFDAGTIESASLGRVDVLVALHACDTATDDAIANWPPSTVSNRSGSLPKWDLNWWNPDCTLMNTNDYP